MQYDYLFLQKKKCTLSKTIFRDYSSVTRYIYTSTKIHFRILFIFHYSAECKNILYKCTQCQSPTDICDKNN